MNTAGDRHEGSAGALFRHDPPTNTRERLLAAALDHFYALGFHAVGLDRICADVGITKQAFYRHFESKDALAEEAIRVRDQREGQAFEEMVRERANAPRAQLLAVFEVLDEWFNHPDYDGCLFLAACHEFPNPNDPVHRAASRHYAEAEVWLTDLARAAGADDPEALAKEVTLLIEGAISYRLVAGDNAAAKVAARLARRAIESRLPG